jgi:hypothetical protein
MQLWGASVIGAATIAAAAQDAARIEKPGRFAAITEPPCSYVSTQHRKKLIDDEAPVVAWLRGAHNGGCFPLEVFLAGPRVVNDTYGLFFFDPDGGFVAAYEKDYGFEFLGWQRGVMLARGKDGTIWSALSGRAIDGPQKGARLKRVPSLTTRWGHWRMLHPESTTYDLFDGMRYPVAPVPGELSEEARASMGEVDARLPALTRVLGVEIAGKACAFPLDPKVERACFLDVVGSVPVAAFWYAPTETATAFARAHEGRELTFHADSVSPETAPFKDQETKTRWTLAGRGVDGPLLHHELTWVDSLQCRWYAWVAEHPDTAIHGAAQ